MQALEFLRSMDMVSLILLFWYTTLLEVPRYLIGGIAIAVSTLWGDDRSDSVPPLSVSVLLVGHNESKALPRCVASLAEQVGVQPQIIVVDDGSIDGMAETAGILQRQGLIDQVVQLHQRGGKSAGVNLALGFATCEIVVIADADTTFDRDALQNLLVPFVDSRVGAVSGDLGVLNRRSTLITRFQAIEYAIGISLGRRISDMFGTMAVVSGAFGAFRRTALEAVGGQDMEIGEDADLTMKLRRAGWRIRFAPDARALTHAPESTSALINQRLRWDRSLVTIWLRKFRGAFDPRLANFRLREVFTLLDVLVFQYVLALAFPAYVIWLFYWLGDMAAVALGAILMGYVILDVLAFLSAMTVRPDHGLSLLPYLPLYTVLQMTLMRSIRVTAILQELVFRSSYRDPYVPARVMRQVEKV